jgi:hypothetical protein
MHSKKNADVFLLFRKATNLFLQFREITVPLHSVAGQKDPGSASKNLSIFIPKIVSKLGNMILDVHPGSGS